MLRVLGLLGFFVCLSASSFGSGIVQFEGRAYDLETEDLLYIEKHRITTNVQGQYLSGQVDYVLPGGRKIAHKSLNFSDHLFAPKLSFVDQRFNDVIRLSGDAKGFLIELSASGETKKYQIKPKKADFVADAGFDRYVLKNWGDLLSGERLAFDFVALTRGELIRFRIEKINQDEQQVEFEIRPDNWLIRLLVEPIALSYDMSTRRLAGYSGVTNIRDAQGSDNYKARIEYIYD